MSGVAKKLMSAAGAGGDVGAWDLSYAYYDPPNAWDISTAQFQKFTSVQTREDNPKGIFFKPDGTKMYVTGSVDDVVLEYDLSTPWDIGTDTFVHAFSVSPQELNAEDVFFKPDGTKMYIVGTTGDDVNEYDLSTAWSVSTAVFLQNFSVAAQETAPTGLFFKTDGTKMYVIGQADDVNEYDLSTAWDISTASFLQSFSVAVQESSPQGLSFKDDGTKMYVTGVIVDGVYEYDLSTAWDVSTSVFLQLFSVATQDTQPRGIFFRPDGVGFYMVGTELDRVYQYTLGGFSVAAQDTVPESVFFKPDGTKMYILGSSGDDVNEYNLSTAWDVSSATFLQSRSVSAQETVPAGLFFKPDGAKMYVVGNAAGGGDVNEYDLSTAWDVSTATFLQSFNAPQDTTANAVFLKPDGTKMYVTGQASDSVHEYNLSTPWALLTATFLQSFSVAAQETSPNGLFFKPDGAKMYVVGIAGDAVYEYNLSTSWDVSTASYLQNFSVATEETISNGLFFKPDGAKMYVVGQGSDSVFSYTLGVQS